MVKNSQDFLRCRRPAVPTQCLHVLIEVVAVYQLPGGAESLDHGGRLRVPSAEPRIAGAPVQPRRPAFKAGARREAGGGGGLGPPLTAAAEPAQPGEGAPAAQDGAWGARPGARRTRRGQGEEPPQAAAPLLA